MRKRLAAAILLAASGLSTAQQAYANCMKNAEDAVWAVVSAGASYAACVAAELVEKIKSLMETVDRMLTDARKQASEVANAALGAIQAGADEGLRVLEGAQRGLAGSTAQARQIASSATTVVRETQLQVQQPAPALASPTAVQQPVKPTAPGAVSPTSRIGAASGPAARTAIPGNGITNAATVNVPADPVQLRSALTRAVDKVFALESEISREVSIKADTALKRARAQAQGKVGAAIDLSRTQLETPLATLKNALSDLAAHPDRAIDPTPTVNAEIERVSGKISETMSHISDMVTHDALTTLNGIEGDIRRAAGNAERADRIVKAMERLAREKNQAALNHLESLIGAGAGTTQVSIVVPVTASFRIDALRGRINAATTSASTPLKTAGESIRSQWATIERARPGKRGALDAQTRQQGEAELDRLFANRSADEVQRQKTELLAKARQRFAHDPQTLAKIQQSLDQQVNLRVKRAVRGVVAPQSTPNTVQPGVRAPAGR